MNIKISIIVPVYKTEKYLRRCLESIVNQSLKEIEIIIVNDGSPDKSYLIIDEFSQKDSRIKVINKKNGGLSSARNAGIEVAKGEFLIHIDSDDWIEQDYFKDMYEKAVKDNLDIVISDILWDYDNGEIEYKRDSEIGNDEIISGNDYQILFFNNKIAPAVWNKMYRLDLYRKYGIRHPLGISLGEDLATTPILGVKARRIGKINKGYVHYIQNSESITNLNPAKKIYELIDAFKILEKSSDINRNIELKKIDSLGNLIFNPNFNINGESSDEVLYYFLGYLKKSNVELTNLEKKMRIYIKIVKKNPWRYTIKLIFYFNKVGARIKKILKKL